jgi:hypothetical protein
MKAGVQRQAAQPLNTDLGAWRHHENWGLDNLQISGIIGIEVQVGQKPFHPGCHLNRRYSKCPLSWSQWPGNFWNRARKEVCADTR